MGLVDAPWQAVILYGIAFGIGNGAVSIAPIGVMVTRRFPGRIGLANAIAISGMGLGQLVIITILAAILVTIGWRSVFAGLATINLGLLPIILWALKNEGVSKIDGGEAPSSSATSLGKVFIKPYFWLLLATYAVCGFQDFFVATHVVAFALDTGVAPLLAGNLLAFLGLAGILGVIAAGASSDRFGPIAAMLICFALRIAIFTLVLIDKGTMSVTLFAVLYGFTFWTTAPLTVVFVRQAFGQRNLGAISGLVTMVHQICGGIGAWLGAANFDARGDYDAMFIAMIAVSVAAVLLTMGLARARRGAMAPH
jgi:predicted MFS family arabinose efflux permease